MTDDAHTNIMFFEIGRQVNGHAQFQRHRSVISSKPGDVISDCVCQDRLPQPGAHAEDAAVKAPFDDWAFRAVTAAGKHSYVFRLNSMFAGVASFAAGNKAVVSLTEAAPPEKPFITNVQTYVVQGENNARWASFEFDAKDVKDYFSSTSLQGLNPFTEGPDAVIELPLHLSIIDEISGLPAWMTGQHRHPHLPGKGHPIVPVHPGFHPPHFVTPMQVEV